MKTHPLLNVLTVATVCLILSCESNPDFSDNDIRRLSAFHPDEVVYPENAKLMRIYVTSHKLGTLPDLSEIDPQHLFVSSEYEYDTAGRLSKVYTPMYDNNVISGIISYNLYIYDSNSRLETIKYYNANTVEGFINLKNTTFAYNSAGDKIGEKIDYPKTGNRCSLEHAVFEYDSHRLLKAEYYACDELTGYTVYEYNDEGENTAEKYYYLDSVCYQTIQHTYSEGLLVKSETYQGKDSEKLREVTFTYDRNRNLISLQSEELLLWSSFLSYTSIYEYEHDGYTPVVVVPPPLQARQTPHHGRRGTE